MNYVTEQEKFWAGDFGDEYTMRNDGEKMLATQTAVFSQILRRTKGIRTCLELGANRGINLMAIGGVIPGVEMQAVEINGTAAKECAKIRNVKVFNGSAFDFPLEDDRYDMTFTAGVLIHIAPERLDEMYGLLYRGSRRYVLVMEYYNPTPVEVPYRGHGGKLFKRDFAGEMLDKYKDLQLVDYGFFYHGDYNFPADDITWFLMEKGNRD